MSDSELTRKWDLCMADAVTKIGTGFRLGFVPPSLTLFKRRMWPLHYLLVLAWDWEWPTPTVSMISTLHIFYIENISEQEQ
uniref:MICOS complex subunit MIC10 n=3 Tax=Canis lupus TaxID=9612 RepID=A0A8C0N1P4_CANLF